MRIKEPDRIGQDLVAQARTLFELHIHDPVIVQHVKEMTAFLEIWQARTPVMAAAWLLVVVKSDLVPDSELSHQFGSRTLQIARLACKLIFVDTDKRSSQKVFHAELARRLFVYAYADYEAVLVTVADQLATAVQSEAMAETELQEWAQRNQNIFIPLLEMLGMWKHRTDITNLTLYLLNSTLYQQLDKQIQASEEAQQQTYEAIATTLKSQMEQIGIRNTVMRLHVTTPASLNRRLEKVHRGESLKPGNLSRLCIDLQLEETLDCYTVLGLIHNTWKPALRRTHTADLTQESRFHDYIAAPRYNGYQCLITTVLYDDQKLVEFRIRTHHMEEVNKYGITAAVLDPEPIKNVWWINTAVRDIVKPGNTGHLNNIPEICVFAPNGEAIYPLKNGSTMIDLAFKIHSALGAYAKGFWANGKPVAMDYVLRHRDLIEIEYDLHYPSLQPEWEDIAQLSSTKTNIRRFLKLRDRAPHRGRRLIDDVLEREMNIYRIRFPDDKTETTLAKIARNYNCTTVDLLYVKVLDGTVSPDEIVAAMFEAELVPHIALENGEDFPIDRIRIAQTWAQEKEPHKWERSSRVVPSSEVVGKITGRDKNRILTIYRKDSRFAPVGDQAVALRWRSPDEMREAVEITVIAPPKSHVIGMVFNTIHNVGKEKDQERINIHRFNSELQEGQFIITALIDAPSTNSLHSLQDGLKVIQRNNYIIDFKIWQLLPGHKLLIAGRSDKRQQNPYTLKHVGNRNMFYGRQNEIKRVIENIEEGHLIVLYGQKRIGKTSLLNQLAENLLPQNSDVLPVTFDVHSLSPFSTQSFLMGLADATREKLNTRLRRQEDRKGLKFHQRNLQTEPFKAFAEWVHQVQERLKGTRLVFMIDEFTRAEEECQRGNIDQSFFDGLQWLAGTQNIGFVLCVHDHIILREGNYSWGLLQRGEPIRLDALDKVSATKLVQQPLENLYKIEPELVNRILQLTNCHPYFIQAICHTLITQMSQMEHDYITTADLDRAVREVLVNGDHYFSHLRSRISEHDWDVVKIIAYVTDPDQKPWVNSDEIRSAMKRFNNSTEGWRISKSIGDLKHAGIIEAQDSHNQAAYRIPVGLFHMWLRQVVTHLTVSRDLERED